MTQSKNTRGVQERDVWMAADALIAEGLRPTIERVRQKIGRGSPNTVSPMLETWFATLGARLGAITVKAQAPSVPQQFQSAMEGIWQLAQVSAQADAEERLLMARQSLDESIKSVDSREIALRQREEVLLVQHAALENALRTATNKIDDLVFRLGQSQALASKREAEIDALRSRMANVEDERNTERNRAADDVAQHARDRQRYEERSEATQRKLLEEVDKARQEAKKLGAQAALVKSRLEADKASLQQKIHAGETEIAKCHESTAALKTELTAMSHAVSIANSRADERQSAREKDRASDAVTIAKLTKALSIQSGRQVSGNKPLVRKLKRPIRN